MKLHLGCGKNIKEGWVNMDVVNYGQEVVRDIRRGIPFNNETFDEIYAQHFIEHVPSGDDTIFLINELYRVLKPGGILKFEVPHSSEPEAFDPIHVSYWNERCIQEYFTGIGISRHWSGLSVSFEILKNEKVGIELQVELKKQ